MIKNRIQGGGTQMGTTSHVPLQLLPCSPPPIGRFYPTSLLPRFSSSTSHLPLNFCRHPASLMHCPPFAYPNNLSLVYEKKSSQGDVRDRDFTVPLSPHVYQTDKRPELYTSFDTCSVQHKFVSPWLAIGSINGLPLHSRVTNKRRWQCGGHPKSFENLSLM